MELSWCFGSSKNLPGFMAQEKNSLPLVIVSPQNQTLCNRAHKKKWRWGLEIWQLKRDGTCGNKVILQSWNKSWRRGSALPQASLILFVEQKFQQWPPAAVHGLFYPQLNCKLIFFLFYKGQPATLSLALTIKKAQAFIFSQSNINSTLPTWIVKSLSSKTPGIYGLF